MKEACAVLGINSLVLRLRTGGATHYFRLERNLGKLQFAGRWQVPKTMLVYLQEPMSACVVNQIPPSVVKTLKLLEPFFKFVMLPPYRFSAVSLFMS